MLCCGVDPSCAACIVLPNITRCSVIQRLQRQSSQGLRTHVCMHEEMAWNVLLSEKYGVCWPLSCVGMLVKHYSDDMLEAGGAQIGLSQRTDHDEESVSYGSFSDD